MLGLGVQARGYVEGWHGQVYRRPVTAMRDFIAILRAAFAGELVSLRGRGLLRPELPSRHGAAAAAAEDLHRRQRPPHDRAGRRGRRRHGRMVPVARVRPRRDDAGPPPRCRARRPLARRLRRDRRLPRRRDPRRQRRRARKGAGDDVRERARLRPGVPRERSRRRVLGGGRGDRRAGAPGRPSRRGRAGDRTRWQPRWSWPAASSASARRSTRYRAAGIGGVHLLPAPPGGFYPLYEDHFPVESLSQLPEFDFPGLVGSFESTIALLAK